MKIANSKISDIGIVFTSLDTYLIARINLYAIYRMFCDFFLEVTLNSRHHILNSIFKSALIDLLFINITILYYV